MKNIIKLGLQTAFYGLAAAILTTLSVYENYRGHDPDIEIKASGRLESGEKYVVADTIPRTGSAFNTEREIFLGNLGRVKTTIHPSDWAQTYNVVGKDGKLILIDDSYIKATNLAPWFSENAISNPNLRAHMIGLANRVLVQEKIQTTIKEGSPNIITAIARESN